MNLPYLNRDTYPFIKNLWLFFVFALLPFGANAQFVGCGEFYNITITNQYDMNQFALNYPGCTQIPGNLRIETSNITDLSQLVQITSVAGGIYIGETNLTNLNGLQNITHVGHDVRIRNNPLLTDISGLSNLNSDFVAWTGFGLEIRNNPLLSTCNLPNFCTYLLNSQNIRTIQNNAGNCSTNAAMVQLCTPATVCPNGSITLNSQAALNAFATNHPNCVQITGNVKIEGDDITDLTPLSNISIITESLTIRTKNLTSLNGLHNLQKIGKYLHIYETELLTTLNGLGALTEVKGEITISTNLALNDISALSNIDSSLIRTVPTVPNSYGITIFGNPQLATCNIPNFCSYLSNPANSRNISNNTGNCTSAILTYACIPEISTCPIADLVFNSQADLDAYGQFYPDCMEIFHSVTISGAVTDLSPLHTIQAIRGNLTISGTSVLTDLDDLSNLIAVYGTITIHNNVDLEDISGLSGIKKINNLNNGLTITNNPALTICEVPNICMYLVNLSNPRNIENNSGNCNNATIGNSCMPVLPTCPVSGLVFNTQAQVDAFGLYYPNCTVIPDSVVISGTAITDLSPLSNIQTIEGELSISGTSGLTNLNDLSSLTSVGGLVSISNNINLQDISGLSGIVSFNGLTITNNPVLTICEVQNICMYVVNPANPRNIGNNSGNCNNATIGNSCIPVLPTCPASNVSFSTQAQVDAHGLYYPNCTVISGSLSISGGTITDLSPLNTIQTINGHLNIAGTSFTNLNSFGNLTSVKNLSIRYNSQLQDISGLSDALEFSVSNSTGLIIEYNPLLATCSIPSICAYTSNVNNPRTINNNAGSCANNGTLGLACETLIPSCPESTSIGFTNQQQLNNFALNYPNCTNFPGDITIAANLDLTPLQNLQTIGGHLSITYNIQDLDGLNALTSIGGNLTIQDSNQLQNLNALQNLASIGGSLIIRNIPSLANLDDLESLTHIGTGIRLEANAALVDISVLSQLNTIVPPNWGTLWIRNNPLLATCNIPYICSYLLNPNASHLILGNAGNCVSRYSIVNACNSTSCATPSNLDVSNITINQAEITWNNSDNFNDFEIEFGPSGFTIGTGTTVSGITPQSYVVSGLQKGTAYDVYLKKDCGYNDSTTLMTTFSTVGYCIPSATNTSSVSEGSYIKDFTTIEAISNLNNTNTGYSVNGYGNFSESNSVSHYPGQPIHFQAVDGGGTGTRGLRIWVDWNSDAVFEASELVYTSSTLVSGTHNGNFQIPVNTTPGNYRMRVFLQENTLASDPCNAIAQAEASGELEDYTLTVLQAVCNDSISITATNVISNKATINWTSAGSLFEMEWGPQGFVLGTGTQQNGLTATSHTLSGLSVQTAYDVYVRNICTYSQSNWVKYTFSTRSVCPAGDVNFTSQAELDDFALNYPYCTHLSGSLSVTGPNFDITNLAPLNNIVQIDGNLSLTSLFSMNSMNGLTSLKVILGQTRIEGTTLRNLDGLSSLIYMGNYLKISGNNFLKDISGIKNIHPLALNSLTITDNLSLAICNYDFLCTYLSGPGFRSIANNATGCQNQSTLLIACATCVAPTNVTYLPTETTHTISWTSAGSSYDIEWGEEGFVQGTGIQQNGITANNFSISDLDLTALATYDIYIRRNCTSGQSQWTKYTFTNADLCPEGNVWLHSQAEVNAFGATYPFCTQIQGYLILSGADITNLSPLSNLTGVGGDLSIFENPQLTDISALQNIVVSSDYSIYIQDNPMLAVCNIDAVCAFMQNSGWVGISNNAPGCNNKNEVAYQCGLECPVGSVSLYSQADVDDFAAYFPNCTAIQYSLNINGADIDDLSPLSNIATIGTTLEIYDNPLLSNLDGLSDLTTLGESLTIKNNAQLTTIAGLQNLSAANITYLNIENNPMLSVCNIQAVCAALQDETVESRITNNASGCENLMAVATACGVEMPACPAGDLMLFSQQDVDDFAINYPNCTHISGGMYIYSDFSITNLDGLSSITSIESGITLEGNPDLTDISGLQNIDPQTIISLTIMDNPNLSVCNSANFCTYLSNPENNRQIENNAPGCESSYQVAVACGIVDCPEADIELASQSDIEQFIIDYPNCTQIQGYLNIYGEDITDLSPLNNIISINGGLAIYECPQLTEINGLSALTNVGSFIYFDANPLITNLNVLSSITNFEGELYVSNNTQLMDISGLQNLDPQNINVLAIENNENLSVCNLPNFCTYLSNFSNPRSISGNAQDCISSAAIENKCFAGNCESYTIWNGDSWSNGDPDTTKRAVILDDLTISADMEACELLLNAGTLTVNAGAVLTVEGEIQNIQAAHNFIVQSDANLIQLDDVDNVGPVTVKRNSFPLYRQDHTLWSSPVEGQNLRNFSPETLFNRFYSYDTAAGTFGEYVQELFTTADTQNKTFADAKGYMIRMPNNWPVFENESIPGTPFAGTFKGVPNNGTITIPLSTANTGMNLVGNPYPSSINIGAFFDANPDIDQTLYFWRKRNGVPGSGYATYTALGLQSSDPEVNGLDLNNMLKPGQGFFVKATAPTVLNFNNQMRSGGQSGYFLRNGNPEMHRFWLNLTANTDLVAQALIGYVDGATQGVDNGFDGVYFNDSAIALTSLIDTQEYAIQARSLPFEISDMVPLGFKTTVAGSYKISLSAFDGLFEDNQDIFIKDNLTGLQQNLKLSGYEFTTSQGTFNDRFQIVYQSTLGTKNPDLAGNTVVVYQKGKQLHINSGIIPMQKIELLDVRGRLIHTQDGINNTVTRIDQLNITNQVLIVKIHLDDNREEIRKIVY